MIFLINTLWFFRTSKYILFWIYLWQLKDYHVGRFIDHFRTHKGRGLIFDFIQIFKLVLLVFFITSDKLFVYLFYILLLVYLYETLLFLRGILNKSFKKPIETSKTIVLTGISFIVLVLFFFWVIDLGDSLQPVFLLEFDILAPLIISAIILLFQPISVLARNNILKKAEQKIKKIRAISNLKVIAITGSYGKTSTKEFLSVILSKKYKVLKTKEHQNSEVGVARCILEDLKPFHQIFIAEVGAYNKGKVKEVCSILKPQIGVVTGVNEQHMALFGSLEHLLSAEGGGELSDALPKDGLLILNGDNKYCLDLYKKAKNPSVDRRKIYTLNNQSIDSDIWTDSLTVHRDYISFLATNKLKDLVSFNVNVLGKQNVQNLLAAALVAQELGMSLEEISEACKNISQEKAGMILKQGKYGISVIDSSYSANPDGVYADLDYLRIFQGKKIIVMPCLIELGDKSSQIHEKIGKKIAEVCDLAIITSKDKFREIKMGAMSAGMKETGILLCDKVKDIHSVITLFCKSGDAVLLEGRVPKDLINLLVK